MHKRKQNMPDAKSAIMQLIAEPATLELQTFILAETGK